MNSLRHAGFVPYIRPPMTGPAGSLPVVSVSVARTTLNVAIFFATLFGACTLIGGFLPFPKVDGIYQKWAYFRAHKDQYDVLFLGSSRFYRQIVPRQFDDRVKAASGREFRSFNCGLDAMWPPESCFMLRELLSLEPKRLRWVFIEVMEIVSRLDDRNLTTRRMAYWHDWRHTRMVCSAISAGKQPIGEKCWLYTGHLAIYFRERSNQGRGAEWLSAAFGMEKGKSDRKMSSKLKEDGYAGRDRELEGPERERYERFLAKAKVSPPLPLVPISDALREALDRMIAEVRAAGAEPILVVSPSLFPNENFTNLPENVSVWSFLGANEYPDLYDPRHRFDIGHLNTAGARTYTDLLSARFANQIAERK
jgi:hypothetical protein